MIHGVSSTKLIISYGILPVNSTCIHIHFTLLPNLSLSHHHQGKAQRDGTPLQGKCYLDWSMLVYKTVQFYPQFVSITGSLTSFSDHSIAIVFSDRSTANSIAIFLGQHVTISSSSILIIYPYQESYWNQFMERSWFWHWWHGQLALIPFLMCTGMSDFGHTQNSVSRGRFAACPRETTSV